MTKDLLINPLVYYAALHNAQKPHAALCGFAHPVYYVVAGRFQTGK
jgi:hypothetical protein